MVLTSNSIPRVRSSLTYYKTTIMINGNGYLGELNDKKPSLYFSSTVSNSRRISEAVEKNRNPGVCIRDNTVLEMECQWLRDRLGLVDLEKLFDRFCKSTQTRKDDKMSKSK